MADILEGTVSHAPGGAYFIALITGVTPDDESFWCYLAVPFEKYDLYCLAEQQGDFDLEDYGQVLAYDLGEKPPNDVKVEMKRKYKLDHDFENKLAIIQDFIEEGIG